MLSRRPRRRRYMSPISACRKLTQNPSHFNPAAGCWNLPQQDEAARRTLYRMSATGCVAALPRRHASPAAGRKNPLAFLFKNRKILRRKPNPRPAWPVARTLLTYRATVESRSVHTPRALRGDSTVEEESKVSQRNSKTRNATSLLVLLAIILGTLVPSFAATQRRRTRRRTTHRVARTAPPPVRYYTVPAKHVIRVRMDTELNSRTARSGDRFAASVPEPVYGGGSGVTVV